MSLALLLPNLALADLVDFGTTTKKGESGGFLVTGVFKGTPADELGIQEGDIVTGIDGHTLQPTTSLVRLIAGMRGVDSEVAVDWARAGEKMSGKVKLSGTLTDEAFDERYPAATAKKPAAIGAQIGGIAGMEEMKDMKLDMNDFEKRLQDAMGGTGFEDLMGGKGLEDLMKNGAFNFQGGASVSKMSISSDGSRVSVQGSGKGKQKVTIKSGAGETLFDEEITKDELDKVPAQYRDKVRGLMGGNRFGGITGGRSSNSNVEESAADLLKKLEKSEEEKTDDGE